MRNRLLPELRIGIARQAVGLASVKGWLRTGVAGLAECPGTGSVEHDLLHLLEGCPVPRGLFRRRFASITAADSLARLFMVTPPHNATGRADLEAATAVRFQALYGEPAGQWVIQAFWHPNRPFPACALPAALHGGLLRIAADHELVLMTVAPRFVAAWNRWRRQLRPGAWFAVVGEDALTLAILSPHGVTSLRSTLLPLDCQADVDWIAAHVRREALVLGLPVPSLVQFCGALKGAQAGTVGTILFERFDALRAPALAGMDGPGIRLALCGAQ